MSNQEPRTYVLEEDQHLQNLRKIIKRDFFGSSLSKEEYQQTLKISLNDYLANFTSKENETFNQLIQADKQKWKSKNWWIQNQDKLLMLETEKYQEQKALPHQFQNMLKQKQLKTNLLAITGQQAKNTLFFGKEKALGSYLSEQHHTSKKVNYSNCRLGENKKKNMSSESESSEDEEPQLLTWGNVENTPLRINQNEFRIPQKPQKDVLLERMTQKIGKARLQKEKQNQKSERLKKIMSSVAPSYRKSSLVRHSSIRRVTDKKQTNKQGQNIQGKNPVETKEMTGLLQFNK